MLVSDLTSKGPVVGMFLDKMQLYPAKIIMFDDSIEYLKSMQEECKKRNILFKGYEYQGAAENYGIRNLLNFKFII